MLFRGYSVADGRSCVVCAVWKCRYFVRLWVEHPKLGLKLFGSSLNKFNEIGEGFVFGKIPIYELWMVVFNYWPQNTATGWSGDDMGREGMNLDDRNQLELVTTWYRWWKLLRSIRIDPEGIVSKRLWKNFPIGMEKATTWIQRTLHHLRII